MSNTIIEITPQDRATRRQEEDIIIQYVLSNATNDERERCEYLWRKACRLMGRDFYIKSPVKTTDEGIEEAAILLGEYRIILANIKHRIGYYTNAKNNT